MISFAGIRKRFGTRDVLRDVSFSAQAGAVTGLVGPNASGKTTLIKIALGLTRADAGTVLVNGAAIDEAGEYRRRIGYMPQIARFPENLTGREVLEMVTSMRPEERPDLELIDALGLSDALSGRVAAMSGGTRQKLNAVIAFLFSPDILILDEPTAGLDPVASGVLKERIARARDEGATVIITSHILSELEQLADDIVFVSEGVLRYSGSAAELQRLSGEAHLEAAIARLLGGAPADTAVIKRANLTLISNGSGLELWQ